MKCPKCGKSVGCMESIYVTEEENLKNLNTAEELLIKYVTLKKYFQSVSKIYCSICKIEMKEES